MEDLFVPVLVYNNKPEDKTVLDSFSEPAWNNPVVRFLDSSGRDLIERKAGVWSMGPLAKRMADSLVASKRDVPKYLQLVASIDESRLEKASFAMHCFWEGEAKLGSLSGVVATRAAWVDGKEVVNILFDPQSLEYEALLKQAKAMECSSTVYTWTDKQLETAAKHVGEQAMPAPADKEPEFAADSDQKYYLRNSAYASLPLTEIQAARINALVSDPKTPASAIHALLSPRQKAMLKSADEKK